MLGFRPSWACRWALRPGLLVNPLGFASNGRTNPANWWSLRDEFRQTAQVLRDSDEGKFVVGAAEPAQPQPIKSENALHVGEEHLDLLAFATRFPVFRRRGNAPRHIARRLMNAAGDLAEWHVRAAMRLHWALRAITLP